jgi:hypothetical protein
MPEDSTGLLTHGVDAKRGQVLSNLLFSVRWVRATKDRAAPWTDELARLLKKAGALA